MEQNKNRKSTAIKRQVNSAVESQCKGYSDAEAVFVSLQTAQALAGLADEAFQVPVVTSPDDGESYEVRDQVDGVCSGVFYLMRDLKMFLRMRYGLKEQEINYLTRKFEDGNRS